MLQAKHGEGSQGRGGLWVIKSANELASLNSGESINGYMEQQEIDELKAWRSRNQVTSVNQFSDVRPTDWAYQALSNLVEKYG